MNPLPLYPLRPPLPRAEQRLRVLHGDTMVDAFAWLRDHAHPEVQSYFQGENNYSEQATAHLQGFKAKLIAEIEGREPIDIAFSTFRVGPFEYFQRPQLGLPHPTWWRHPVEGGDAEMVFDPNAIPGSDVFYSLGVFEPSTDGRYVAFSFDVIGHEGYNLVVRDMETGHDVHHTSERVCNVAWAADCQTLFFTRERADRRPHEVVRFHLPTGDSEVVFEESNDGLKVSVRRSNSGAWLFLDVCQTPDNSSRVQRAGVEVWCLPADRPSTAWRRIVTRELGTEVFADHWGEAFLFRVNDHGPNWRLVQTPIHDTSPSYWEELIPHRPSIALEEVHVIEHHIVTLEREDLRPRLVARDRSGQVIAAFTPDESSCTLTLGQSAGGAYSASRSAYQSSIFCYKMSSFITPDTVFEYDLSNDRRTVVHQASVPGYQAHDYESKVVAVKADDGTDIPVSLVARRDRTAPGPVLLVVYGAHGSAIWPSFFTSRSYSTARLSLLDRGIALGFVHLRGGGEFGRPWHETATRDRKPITFTDLVAAAEGLVEKGIASGDGIVIQGISAGGGTVLATAAMRPDLFRAVIADVPLADMLDTALNSSMPYAAMETATYGDPRTRDDYTILRTYDPYYNLAGDRPLPPTVVEAALQDSQVLCYQPARYVAQRRSCHASHDPELIFRVRTVGGHVGASHGPRKTDEMAFRMAWMLDQLGRANS